MENEQIEVEENFREAILGEEIEGNKVEASNDEAPFPKFRLFSGSTLKWIAIITMVIDHIGATLIEPIIVAGNSFLGISVQTWDTIDIIMRSIGRISFPIFCFLLVEGYRYTKHLKRYLLRLAIFVLISEVPFDLAFFGEPFYIYYNNVFMTLLIGVLALALYDWIVKQKPDTIGSVCGLVGGLGLGLVAEYLNTDYGFIGVASILVLYLARVNAKKWPLMRESIFGAIIFAWEITAPLAFIPVFCYNGKRGHQMKYFFYIFYPAHLLLLGLIRYCVLKY